LIFGRLLGDMWHMKEKLGLQVPIILGME